MADLTPVLTSAITAVTALSAALLGYLGARYRVKADIKRLEIEQAEPHFQHRQAVYHDFLDTVYRFHQDLGGIEPMTQDEMREWFREFEHRYNAVALFGTRAAWKACEAVRDAIGAAMDSPETYSGSPAEEAVLQTSEDAIEAMRPDTAPTE